MLGLLMRPPALSTRDAQLPAAYSDRLESLSLAPLWTALHALLPPERQTRVVPHRWRWSELRAPLLEAARLVPIEQAERRGGGACDPPPPPPPSRAAPPSPRPRGPPPRPR